MVVNLLIAGAREESHSLVTESRAVPLKLLLCGSLSTILLNPGKEILLHGDVFGGHRGRWTEWRATR